MKSFTHKYKLIQVTHTSNIKSLGKSLHIKIINKTFSYYGTVVTAQEILVLHTHTVQHL